MKMEKIAAQIVEDFGRDKMNGDGKTMNKPEVT